jgi:RNA polymerase sigma-70 factor, ECF subfamily
MTQAASTDPDLDLIHLIAQGNKDALAALYSRHGLKLLSYLTLQLIDRGKAEEVLQDVMLAVWKQAAGFRGESKVLTWMLTIARYKAISLRRQNKPTDLPLTETIPAPETLLYENLDQQAQTAKLVAALEQLPADQQEICELVFYLGLAATEIAQMLNIPPGTVKSRLHRAKAALRHTLNAQEITHE